MTTALIESLIQLLVLAPLFAYGWFKNRREDFRPVLYAAAFFIVTELLLSRFSNVIFFKTQHWNWVGKGLVLIFCLLFVAVVSKSRRSSFGLTTKINCTGIAPLAIVCTLYFVGRVILYASSSNVSYAIDPETFLFQATLPGLQEELLFRGILLGLLNSVFLLPRLTILKTEFGLAAIITGILFGLVHGMNYGGDSSLSVNYFMIGRASFDGFLFALLAEKTKSIFPGVILHNLLNLISLH
jgi:membrane protease YdiL (CAAX protease family)